jgi:AraC-like DNA-binding protein
MAYMTKKDQVRFIELGNFVVDYSEGDVLLFNKVRDLTPFFPLKEETTLIVYCTKGEQRIIMDGKGVKVVADAVFICPPNTKVICLEHTHDFECDVMCISDHLVRALMRDKTNVWHQMVYVNKQLIVGITNSFREDSALYTKLIRSKIQSETSSPPYDILMTLLRAFLTELCYMIETDHGLAHEQKLSQGKVLFNRFLSLISSSQTKRLPITHYAGQLAITPKYLTMLCLKYSNKTASDWVAQYTIEDIRYYLRGTELSIKEISAQMGFSNMSHFGSYVRKHLGMSPSEFRYSPKKD